MLRYLIMQVLCFSLVTFIFFVFIQLYICKTQYHGFFCERYPKDMSLGKLYMVKYLRMFDQEMCGSYSIVEKTHRYCDYRRGIAVDCSLMTCRRGNFTLTACLPQKPQLVVGKSLECFSVIYVYAKHNITVFSTNYLSMQYTISLLFLHVFLKTCKFYESFNQ